MIVTSYNRNFPKRNDGLASTLAFVTSPETVVALALAGTLDFDPLTDTLTNDAGEEVRLGRARRRGAARRRASTPGESGFVAPPADGGVRRGRRAPRLATGCSCSSPSRRWDGNDFVDLPILVKAQGKCTTDHISAAGPWLRVPGPPREHLRQPLPRRRQRLHRRGRRGQGPARRRGQAVPRDRQALPRGRPGLGRHRRRELRRGLVPGARGHGAPLPGRQGRHRPVASPASTRPTSRSRACCR